jgi:hypothetical protein
MLDTKFNVDGTFAVEKTKLGRKFTLVVWAELGM